LSLQINDDSDFVADLEDNEEKAIVIRQMRVKLSRLNYTQREIMIMHYIDGFSVSDISKKLQLTKANVKWYLYNSRKIIKKDITSMNTTEYV
jgi:RNA polymerase sigma factor (sigma-70 family)